jgi:flagellar basal body P-ring protein FlgI
MNFRQFVKRAMPVALLLPSLLFLFSGCSSMKWRGQNPESEASPVFDGTQDYVGDITSMWGLSYAKVEGIALATQLEGTGSDPRPSQQRTYLVSEMRAHDVAKPNEILASGDTSLVLVRGFIPPGARKGDSFDVEIRTLPRSETTSLRGGFLMETRLRQMEAVGGQVLQGHVVATVKGPIIIDSVFEKGDPTNDVRGRVLGTAITKHDRPLGLTVTSDNHSVKTTTAIARAINNRFHVIENGGRVGAATPKNDKHVELAIPRRYRQNLARYLEVVRSIKYRESSNDLVTRLASLREQLFESTTSKRAAIRLEAIGMQAKPILQEGLQAADPEVRFNSAMALAYMDEPKAIRELGSAAKVEPAFRWQAMTALAAMDDLEAGIQLTELLDIRSVEARYGAFQALKVRSPSNSVYESSIRPSDFCFHIVPSENFPVIHFSIAKMPELTLLGEDQTVKDNFLIVESGLTIRSLGNGEVKVARFTRRDGDDSFVCSNQVSDVIRSMVELGMGYGEILEIFQQAKAANMLNSKLVVDARPKPRRKSDEQSEEESSKYVAGPIPQMFRGAKVSRDDEELAQPVYFEEAPAKKKGFFAKMTSWWQ